MGSVLLNSTLSQHLANGTAYGSPRTAKGPLVPLPTVAHTSSATAARVRVSVLWSRTLHASTQQPVLLHSLMLFHTP